MTYAPPANAPMARRPIDTSRYIPDSYALPPQQLHSQSYQTPAMQRSNTDPYYHSHGPDPTELRRYQNSYSRAPQPPPSHYPPQVHPDPYMHPTRRHSGSSQYSRDRPTRTRSIDSRHPQSRRHNDRPYHYSDSENDSDHSYRRSRSSRPTTSRRSSGRSSSSCRGERERERRRNNASKRPSEGDTIVALVKGFKDMFGLEGGSSSSSRKHYSRH